MHRLACSIEQLPCKQIVAGSIPASPIFRKSGLRLRFSSFLQGFSGGLSHDQGFPDVPQSARKCQDFTQISRGCEDAWHHPHGFGT